MKKLIAVTIAAMVVVSLIFIGCAPKETAKATIKNPDTFIYATYGTIDSLDPAKAYDNASGGTIQNIYDTLVAFKGSSTTEFVPALAEAVPTVANGGITDGGKTYRFKIRKGVKFQSGNPLTPEDVQYSILRYLVVDPPGGPCWMWYFPLFGIYESIDADGNFNKSFADMQKAVQVDGDYVVIHLKAPYAPFLSILPGYWAGIVDKKFVIEHGGWNGTAADMKRVNRPEEGQETLYEIASGSGPYKLERWEKGVELVMARNENYWGKKPAMARAIYKVVDEWASRKLMLVNGDVDNSQVDPMYYDEMDKEPGLKVYKDLKELGLRGINYNMAVRGTDNPYIGSGKLDGKGIPPDFLANKDVRLAITYCWDQETFMNEILNNAGVTVYTPVVQGLPYYDPNLKGYPFDLTKAEEYFKKALGGKVWENGFTFDMLYNTGNEVRHGGLKMLSENVAKVNPKFKLNVRAVEWAQILDLQRQHMLPIYFMGWGADYPDPDNFVQPYMHSQGLFASRGGYNNPVADKLVEEGALETDPAKRKEIYYALQKLWLEDVIGIVMYQPVTRHYFKDWVKGYYFHPMENEYFYSMFSKGY